VKTQAWQESIWTQLQDHHQASPTRTSENDFGLWHKQIFGKNFNMSLLKHEPRLAIRWQSLGDRCALVRQPVISST
jgi:hypothetical protein